MGFFDKMLGKNEEEVRPPLQHPKDLCVGDIVKFAFLPQDDLTNQRYEVIEVNTYDFEDEMTTSFSLKGESGNIVWLSAVNEDGEEYLAVSKKLTRGQVTTLFDADAFAEVFEEGAGTQLDRIETPEGFEEWTANHYTEIEDCSHGYYHKGDYRNTELPKYEDESESLEFYLLEDDDEDYAVEIEVYKGGDTEVYAVVYLELSAIDELMPGQ